MSSQHTTRGRALATTSPFALSTAAGRAGAVLAALAVGLAAASAATSQEQEGATPSDRIVVTGSRIQRTTDFNSPQPTTVLDSTYLNDLGVVNLGDAMVQMPSNVSTFQPTATGNSNFFAGSTLLNLRGLNPFFGSRTLTLVNSRRHVPTNQGDGVDLNFIPTVLIERVETVTGGASAAYGSGAISGVSNIILATEMEGGRFEADYGVSEEGDGEDYHAAAAYGFTFDGDRGNIVLGGEYQDTAEVGCAEARDWCARGVGTIANNTGFATAGVPAPFTANLPGLPATILTEGLRQNQQHVNGVFLNTGLKVNAAGDGTEPWIFGGPSEIAIGAPFRQQAGNVIGGEGDHIYRWTRLRTPVERYVVQGLGKYQVTPSIDAFVEGSYGKVETLNVNSGSETSDSMFAAGTIASDNAYLLQSPELVAAQALGAAPSWIPVDVGGGVFVNVPLYGPYAPQNATYSHFAKDWTEQTGVSTTLFDTKVWRFAAGLEGDFGDFLGGDWSWDAYYQIGETKRTQYLTNLVSNYRYFMALDAVYSVPGDPTSEIVCRVTRDGINGGLSPQVSNGYTSVIDGLAQGCVPINPFGTQGLTDEAYDYAFGYLREDLTYRQQVAGFNAAGDLFEGFGAGPVGAAVGVEFRKEEGDNVAAEELDAARRADFPIQYGESFAGDVDVWEAYTEVDAPVVAGLPFADLVEVDAAIRQSRYENTSRTPFSAGVTSEHDITTWKVSGTWDINENIRIRGSQSRDVRAPNLRELYYRQIIPAGGFFGQFTNARKPDTGFGSQTDLVIYDLQGNVGVEPEKADTSTLGVVLRPGGIAKGLEIAVDYYDLELKDSITQANTLRVINGCMGATATPATQAEFCPAMFDVNGVPLSDPSANDQDVARIVATSFNASEYNVRGVDYSVGYTLDFGADQSIAVRAIATNMLEQFYDNGGGSSFDYVNELGDVGFLSDIQASPEWQGTFALTYRNGPASITGQARWVGSGKVDITGSEAERLCADPVTQQPAYCDNSRSSNEIEAYGVFNVTASYDLLGDPAAGPSARSVQLWGSVSNLFDRDPPLFGGATAGTNAIFYDVLGRSYRVGVRTRF